MNLNPLHPAQNITEAFTQAGFQVVDLLAFTRRSTVLLIETATGPQVIKVFFGSDHVLDRLDEKMRSVAYGFYWYNSQSEEVRKHELEAVETEILVTEKMSGQKGWPQVVDKGSINGIPYLQMIWISGQKLTLPNAPNRESIKKRVKWLTEVACALDKLHLRGFVHRDIYHENILVSDNEVYIIDLGAARPLTSPLGPKIRGPEVHWPPEYLDNYSLAGPPSDIYSLGVLLHRTFTGDLPRIQSSPKLTLVATPRIADFVLTCLAYEPTARPKAKTVADWLSDIYEFIDLIPNLL